MTSSDSQERPNRDERACSAAADAAPPVAPAPVAAWDSKRTKAPPIKPAWLIGAAAATLVLLLLTAWRVMCPPEPTPIAPPVASPTAAGKKRHFAAAAATTQQPGATSAAQDDAAGTVPTATHDAAAGSGDNAKKYKQPSAAVQAGKVAEGPAEEQKAAATAKDVKVAGRDNPLQSPAPSVRNIMPPQETAAGKEDAAAKDVAPKPNLTIVPKSGMQHAPEDAEEKEQLAADKAAEAQQWLADAQAFAAQRQGILLEAKPFAGGALRVSPGLAVQKGEEPLWFLGGGWLKTTAGVYEFGPRYRYAPPVMRQEMPELANQLGAASAAIELQQHDSGLELRAVVTATHVGAETVAEQRGDLVKLRARRDRLNYLLREWIRLESISDTAEMRTRRADLGKTMANVLEAGAKPASPTPETAPKAAADAATQKADEERMVRRVRDEIVNLDRRMQQVRVEAEEALAKRRAADAQVVARFQASCETITVVVYQLAAPASETSAATETPMPKPRTEPVIKPPVILPPAPKRSVAAQSASPRDLQATKDVPQWEVAYRTEEVPAAFSTNYTEMAQLVVQVASASGALLPRAFRDDYYVNCTIWEYPREGAPRSRELIDVAKPRPCSITAGTAQVAVRFWFARKNAVAGGNARPQAETPWHVIPAIQKGAEYRVVAPVSREMLSSLQEPAAPRAERKKR